MGNSTMGKFNRWKESGLLVDPGWALFNEASFTHVGNFYKRNFRWHILIEE